MYSRGQKDKLVGKPMSGKPRRSIVTEGSSPGYVRASMQDTTGV